MSTYWKDTDIAAAIAGKESERNRALQYLVQGSGWRIQVIRHVVNNSGTEEDGEELFFDALSIFERNVREGKFEGRSSMNTYFIQIAKFQWLKKLDKRGPKMEDRSLMETDLGVEDSAERSIIAAEHEQVFAQIMSQIGARCKRIFELFHMGYSMIEIAQEVGISDADQAKKEKSRCKKRLLNLLSERPEFRDFFKER